MSVVGAYLFPGSPLPMLVPENPPWVPFIRAYEKVGQSFAELKADAIVLYSTQWIAVLDQLWQTRPRIAGKHVDENWHQYPALRYDFTIDTELAQACINMTTEIGVKSREVNYDEFPIDSGTIVAAHYLNKYASCPFVLTSNNLYHSSDTTRKLGAVAAKAADKQKKRVAVVGVGNLSGSAFRQEIDIAKDHIACEDDDKWNQTMLGLIEHGDIKRLQELIPEYARKARVDMGFKHMDWILGATGGRLSGANIHAYGPVYGSGAAVIEFKT
jgi:2-aminophenol/2-amino-5-chlorophenol 1,6-dioxygenase subunit alpha